MRILFCYITFLFFYSCEAQHTAGGLKYRHRPAAESKKNAPVVIMLHGYGSNENDLFGLAELIPPQFHVFSVRAPQNREGGGYAWFHLDIRRGQEPGYDFKQAEQSRKNLLKFISVVCRQFGADSTRVLLFGFSQGAMMSFDLALNAPEKIYGAIALSGAIVPESIPAKDEGQIKNLRFFIGHCNGDEVVPIARSEEAARILRNKKAEVTFNRYPGVHQITPACQKDVKRWLQKLVAEE